MSEATWFYAILGATLKSTVILGAAWLIAILLRRRSAAARHLVWTAAAAAVLALPFLSLSLPPLPVRTSTALVNPGLVFQVFGIARGDALPQSAAAAGTPARPAGNTPWRPDLMSWLIWIWTAG